MDGFILSYSLFVESQNDVLLSVFVVFFFFWSPQKVLFSGIFAGCPQLAFSFLETIFLFAIARTLQVLFLLIELLTGDFLSKEALIRVPYFQGKIAQPQLQYSNKPSYNDLVYHRCNIALFLIPRRNTPTQLLIAPMPNNVIQTQLRKQKIFDQKRSHRLPSHF